MELEGKKIVVVRGDREDRMSDSRGRHIPINEGTTYSDHASWIAGKVPVGSTGTLRWPEGACQYTVEWDHEQPAKEGYSYCVSGLSDQIQLAQ